MSFWSSVGNVASNIGNGLVNIWERIAYPEIAEQRALANSMKSAVHQHDLDMEQQSAANEYTSEEAERWNYWQAEREDTAIQRKVADMKDAGINPVMLYGNFDGASSASPSVPTASTASSRGGNYRANNDTTANEAIRLLAMIASGLIRKSL